MRLRLPFEVLSVLRTLHQGGFEAFLVGGAVRDLILQTSNHENTTLITDYDFTTNARPAEIQALFPENFYENTFGTVSVTHENLLQMLTKHHYQIPVSTLATRYEHTLQHARPTLIDLSQASKLHSSLIQPTKTNNPSTQPKPFEITTYRSDGTYDDHRRPNSVSWGKTIEDDLDRRDFTINAIALRIKPDAVERFFDQKVFPSEITLEPSQYECIDPHQGIADLARGEIKAVGDPNIRFREDSLRMLRAVRFSAQLGMRIVPHTLSAIKEHAALLSHVSWERIQVEFLKILTSPLPRQGIEFLDQTSLLEYIMPELLEGKGVRQGGHHTTDVWEHSLEALAQCPSSDPIVRLATLLHDIGKPRTQNTSDGKITFYNHEIVGSRMAVKIAQRLKLSKNDTDRIFILVRHHMFYYQPHNTDASIRRFMRKVGLDNIDDILDLREGDRLGSGARKTSWRLEEMKQRMVEQLNQPLSVHDLALNGHDLIAELNMQPGKKMGEILNQLFEKVLENPELNTKEVLLNEAKKLL